MTDINHSPQFQSPTQRTFRKIFLHYLKKNASKPAILLKLMQISKFFCFKEFPFLIVKELEFEYDRWGCIPLGTDKYESYDEEEAWVTRNITMIDAKEADITKFLHKIAVLGLKELCLGHQNLTLKQFSFLTYGPIFILSMWETIVTNENDDIVPVEILLKLLPSAYEVFYDYNDKTAITATKESTANITEILKNSKIKVFGLQEIPDTFDFDTFCKFLNLHVKNLYMKRCNLHFRKDISIQFQQNIQDYHNQMIKETTDKYYPLGLSFPGR